MNPDFTGMILDIYIEFIFYPPVKISLIEDFSRGIINLDRASRPVFRAQIPVQRQRIRSRFQNQILRIQMVKILGVFIRIQRQFVRKGSFPMHHITVNQGNAAKQYADRGNKQHTLFFTHKHPQNFLRKFNYKA